MKGTSVLTGAAVLATVGGVVALTATSGSAAQEAADAPRFRHMSGLKVALEAPLADQVRAKLQAMGHQVVTLAPGSAGGAQIIIRLDKGWVAGSDRRKDGEAAGY